MGGIFISYRREDSSPWAGRIYERLAREFPREQILMDVDAIEPGLDFVKVLDEQVQGCDALLVIIGPKWASAQNEDGVRRLDDPDDFVAIEVGSALKHDVRVIPALVEGARMPRADELPTELKPLSRRNAVMLTHNGFGADTQNLIGVLKRILQRATVAAPIIVRPPPPAPRDETAQVDVTVSREKRNSDTLKSVVKYTLPAPAPVAIAQKSEARGRFGFGFSMIIVMALIVLALILVGLM